MQFEVESKPHEESQDGTRAGGLSAEAGECAGARRGWGEGSFSKYAMRCMLVLVVARREQAAQQPQTIGYKSQNRGLETRINNIQGAVYCVFKKLFDLLV